MPWNGWPFERIALLFIGLGFGLVSVQVFLMHLGGAFHRWQMWVPVLYGPVLTIVGLGMAAKMSPEIAAAGLVLFGLGVLDGLIGTFYHFRAIGHYVLGFTLRNFIGGPPPVLPIIFAALSGFGMLASHWAGYLR